MWDLPAHLEFDTGLRYVSQIANLSVPEYGGAGCAIMLAARQDLELSIVGQNLLHAHHPEFGPPASRNEIERSVYGKITWRF